MTRADQRADECGPARLGADPDPGRVAGAAAVRAAHRPGPPRCPDSDRNLSISELATRCSTSTTSVVRFCRRMDYARYKDRPLDLTREATREEFTTSNLPEVSGDIDRVDTWPTSSPRSWPRDFPRRLAVRSAPLPGEPAGEWSEGGVPAGRVAGTRRAGGEGGRNAASLRGMLEGATSCQRQEVDSRTTRVGWNITCWCA